MSIQITTRACADTCDGVNCHKIYSLNFFFSVNSRAIESSYIYLAVFCVCPITSAIPDFIHAIQQQ